MLKNSAYLTYDIVSVKFNGGAWTDILYQLNLDARNFIRNNQEYCLSIVANNTKLSDVRKHYFLSLTVCMLGNFSCFCCRLVTFFIINFFKVRNAAKIRNRYNQVPHLTQDTTWESDKNTIKNHKQEPRGQPFLSR